MPKPYLAPTLGALLLALSAVALAQSDATSPVVSERVVSDTVLEEPAATEGQEQEPKAAAQRSVRTVQKDAGSSIEELRVGGQTQEINVQPAGSAPAYQVRPANNNTYRHDSGRHSREGTNGPRVWNVLEF